MDVYDFLYLCGDPDNAIVRVYDLANERVVYDSMVNHDGNCDPSDMEYNGHDLTGYDVDGFDVYKDKASGFPVLELNITMDKEDDE